jgi:hypothetical protein
LYQNKAAFKALCALFCISNKSNILHLMFIVWFCKSTYQGNDYGNDSNGSPDFTG